jgi:hypothetical protein
VNEKDLRAEIRKLGQIIAAAAKRAEERNALIDKLTAALLHVDMLMKQLRRRSRRRRRQR